MRPERVQVSAVHVQRQETPLLSGCVMRAAGSRQRFSRALEDVDEVHVCRSRAKLLQVPFWQPVGEKCLGP